MAVDAVASVVLQKLRIWLSEEPFTESVIGDQLQQMQKALEEMSGFFMDAANKETNEDTQIWISHYLRELYSVEDSIESFALRITRQRKRYGFLMNHALFLKKFTACKKLGRKVKKTRASIDLLKYRKPEGLENASLRGENALENSIPRDNDGKMIETEEDYDSHEAESNHDSISNLRSYTSSPPAVIKQGEENPSFRNPNPNPRSINMLRRSESSFTRHTYSNTEEMSIVGVAKLRNSPTAIIKEGGDDHPALKRAASSSRLLRRTEASFMRERFQQAKLTRSYSYNEEELSIIGYKRRVTKLWNRVKKDRIISIVGEPGSGKTMLARAIYGNRDFKNRFKHSCAWISIFKDSQPKDILHNLLKQLVQKEEDSGTSEDDLKLRLSDKLKNRSYLIVLDGVQSLDQWKKLKDAFPNPNAGNIESKIIVTTTIVNSEMKPHEMGKLHEIGKLRRNESWALFLRKVGFKKEEAHQVSDYKNKIIKVCQGLPLNIVLLGSLLSIKDKEIWDETLDTHTDWKTSDIVMLSYNDLDPHMKLCLLYMMMFPKDLDIPVRRLQRLWLAEGFVERANGKFEEDVVQEYFQNLVKRSLIMVTKLRSDGSHRKCRLLGALHDHLLPNANYLSLFHVHGGSDCSKDGPPGRRRLVEYADGKNCSLTISEYRHLRSYISFNLQKKDTPALYVGDLVGKMIGKKGYGLLRVLDLEGVYKPSLPENLGDLFHLRYLGLRWTFLDNIPKSVGELPYLETLDLKHTFINRIPQSIWKLKHLRHLNLNEIHLDKDSRLQIRESLPKLLTLWGLSVDQDCPIENGLTKFEDLRELGISLRFSKSSSSSESHDQVTRRLVYWISKLTELRQLRLRSKDDLGNPAKLHLTSSFSSLKKLSHMKLLGNLQKLPQRNDFPPHIKVLTLSVSRLTDDPMPVLGQLPELTVLRLLASSYMGDKMVCPADSFKNLLDLKLWMLCNLEKWEVEKGAMVKLKELNIRFCPKLEKVPVELLQQKAFQDLILNDMSDEFKTNAGKINDVIPGKLSITVKNHGFRMKDYQ